MSVLTFVVISAIGAGSTVALVNACLEDGVRLVFGLATTPLDAPKCGDQ